MKIERIIYIQKNQHDALHCHRDFHEFHVGLAGRAQFSAGLGSAAFGAGSFAYVPPGWQHQMVPDPELTFYYILFMPEAADAVWTERLERHLQNHPVRAIPDFRPELFAEIEQLCRSDDDFLQQCAVRMLLGKIFAMLARQEGEGDLLASVKQAVAYMRENLHRTRTVKQIADECGLAVSSVIRSFSRQLGMTPHQFFIKLKIENACYLLNHTDQPIKAIAADLAFCDEYHFSKVFKQHVAQPPGRYRQSMMLVQ